MNRSLFEESAEEAGLILSETDIQSFEIFSTELIKWNRRLNLTSITRADEMAVKHFIDSLFLARHLDDDDYMLDIGSGAGFPVLPLKIVKPGIRMVSVDAVAKKVNFQRHIIRLLSLNGIEALHSRVEDMYDAYTSTFSVITSRAFTRLDRFVSLAAPLLGRGGRLIAMKGADAGDEIAASEHALEKLGFAVTAIHPYNLPKKMGDRCLAVLKVREAA